MSYDAGKQVKSRKIHALVDSEGLPMRIWADGGYNAWQVDAAVAKVPPLRTDFVKRGHDMEGLVVLPRRWGWSSALSPSSDETSVSPRTSRT